MASAVTTEVGEAAAGPATEHEATEHEAGGHEASEVEAAQRREAGDGGATPAAETPSQTAVPSTDDGGVWVAFAKGAAAGIVGVGVLVAAISLALGLGWTVALALAAFTGVWGGPGFGGMMGAVLHHARTKGD